MLSVISRVTLVTLAWLAAGLAISPAAHACSLPAHASTDRVYIAEQKVRSADVAIYGVVASVRMLEPEQPDVPTIGQRFEARVRVTRVFRGMTVRVIRVLGDTNGAGCGIGQLRVGERLGLLLDRPARPFTVRLGSRITLAELLRGTHGKWRRPR